MSRAGLKPSAAITRGMTDTHTAMMNNRWLRHSAAGLKLAATVLAQLSNVPVFPEIAGGHSRKLHCRPVPAPA